MIWSAVRALPSLGSEVWDSGFIVTYREVPFPYRRPPTVPSRLIQRAKPRRVPFDRIYASQTRVTDHGLTKYRPKSTDPTRDTELPLLYEEPDGSYTVGDGHHRTVAKWLQGHKTLNARVAPYEDWRN